MSYKRKLFNDKTIIAAAAVGVIAVSAIVGGVMLDDGGKDGKNIVELDDGGQAEKEPGNVVSDDDNIIAENVGDSDKDDKNITPQGTPDKKEEPTSIAVGEKPTGTDETHIEDSEGQINKNNQSNDKKDDTESKDVNISNGITGLNFNAASTLIWPVEGNIIIDFDMENTVYFPTLDVYKCSDAVYVQSAVDTPIYAGSACSIEGIEYNSELGNNVTVSLGNGYMLTYGQLKDVQVENGQVLEEGDLIGYVGAPTKYYTVEGAHLYMKMTCNGEPVDPLDYLNYED